MEQKKKQDHKFYGGFRYAIEGILTGIRQEQNMKMHCIMTVLVVLAGFFFEISKIEWCICLLLCGLIMALELVNTSVEAAVDSLELFLLLPVPGVTLEGLVVAL